MRSYNSLKHRTLNVLVKKSNILTNTFQTNYLGNTVSAPSGGGGGSGNVDLSSYALKTYVDGSLNNIYTNYALISGVYTRSYIDASFNGVYTRSYIDASFNGVYTKSRVDASFADVYTKSRVDASFNGVYTKSRVDASFADVYTKSYIDASFNGVYTRSYIDASFNGVYTRSYIDASFNGVYTKSRVDASFADVYTKSYIDASFNTVNTRLYTLTNGASESLDTLAEIASAIQNEPSFGIMVYQKISSSDLSINNLRSMISGGSQDTSINLVIAKNTAQDISINLLTTSNTAQDISINLVITKNTAQDTSINLLTTSNTAQDTSINLLTTSNTAQDISINLVITKNTAQDISINLVITKNTAQDISINNVYTRSYIDASFSSVIANNTTLDLSLNGNLQLGSGNRRVGINKTAAVDSSLDVSGAATITGNLSVIKNSSDASYSYFDLSSVNINLFNTVEKFTTLTFNSTSMTLDYRLGSIFYTTATSNFAALLITNVPTTLNRSVTVTLITPQSGTFYFTGTAITVNGTSINYIKQDGTAFAAPSASRTLIIYQFTLIFASSTPTVVAFMTGYS